jgi:hypothetical protein
MLRISVFALALLFGCTDQAPKLRIDGTYVDDILTTHYLRLTLTQNGESVSGTGLNIRNGTRELTVTGSVTDLGRVSGDLVLTMTVVGSDAVIFFDGSVTTTGMFGTLNGGPYVGSDADFAVLLEKQ